MTEELLTNDEEDVAELEDTALLELFAEDELATLDELAALLLLLTEELLTNDEEDVAELEDTALLELFAEDELATLDELAALLLLLTEELLTNDEEDVAELEDTALLELFAEDELKNRVAPPIISSSAEASFAEIFVHSPSKQRRKSLPTASATQPSNFSSQTFSPLPSANAITSLVPFSTELELLSSPQAIKKRDDTKAIDESIFINIVDTFSGSLFPTEKFVFLVDFPGLGDIV